MRFDLNGIIESTDAGMLKGIQREIACDCWFTCGGKTIPRSIKVMDEEGCLHTIKDIHVLFSEEKTYSGIKTIEHVCKIYFAGMTETVKLVFTKESCKWTIVKV